MDFNKKFNRLVKITSFVLLFSLVFTNVFVYRVFAETKITSSVKLTTLNKFRRSPGRKAF